MSVEAEDDRATASLDSVPARRHTGSPFAPVFFESVGV